MRRLSWGTQGSLKCNHMSPYKWEERRADERTKRGGKVATEAEVGVMLPRARPRRRDWEPEKHREWIVPGSVGREHSLANLEFNLMKPISDFQCPDFQNNTFLLF